MSEFDDATAVQALDDDTLAVNIHPGWRIGDKPNGGYLMAMLGRAAGVGLGRVEEPPLLHPHPLSASVVYLRAPDAGPASVTTEVMRIGRSASQVRAVLHQDGQACVDAVFILGRLGRAAEVRWQEEPPVELPPLDDCVRLPAQSPGGIHVATLDRTDIRLDPAVMGLATGARRGRAELRGWLQLADGREPDPLSLLYVIDAMPPATFEIGSSGWVPTLQLTAYVRALPAPGPLRVRQRARLVDGDTVDEVCDVWDSTGRLVAQGFQLARVRFVS